MNHRNKLINICLITIFVLTAAACSFSTTSSGKSATYTPLPPTPAPDLKVMFLGERLLFFWYWPQTHYQNFAHAADPTKYIAVDHLFPGGIDVNSENLITFWENPSVQDLFTENYDVIILQESQERTYEEKDQFHEYTRKFYEKAQSVNSELILFMVWPEENRWDDLDEILVSYDEIASELGIKVAPVGLAWANSLENHPELDLFFDDGELASKYGDYLAMCVVYATITGESPEGVDYTGYLSDEEAIILQEIAWETVQEYQQK